MTIYTFQTVKLSLEAWRIVEELSERDAIPFSYALERLVRHGSIRIGELARTQTLDA